MSSSTLEGQYSSRVRELRAATRRAQESGDAEAAEAASREEVEYLLRAVPLLKEYAAPAETRAPPPPRRAGQLDAFVEVLGSTNRQRLLQRYMAEVEGDAARADAGDDEGHRSMVCESCNVNLVVDRRESSVICPSCGHSRPDMLVTEGGGMTYKEETTCSVISYFAYKRLNHFCEWLNSLQAKENTDIPAEVLDAVRVEFRKARISTRGDIKPQKVREFLKKLKLNKYYEHTHHICNALNGVPPPRLSPSLEARLKQLFAEIQEPFEKHCPATRKNFLSYSYVLYKFCELLGHDELLPYFPLLKSSEKLYAQDAIWKKICGDLNWEFIKSV